LKGIIGFYPMIIAFLDILRFQLKQDAAHHHGAPHRLAASGELG
jgi:hypothetical protein